MSKQDAVELTGRVMAIPGGGFYRVKVVDEKTPDGVEVLCKLSGKMAQHKITVALGDHVKIAVSPYDLSRGRITFRERH